MRIVVATDESSWINRSVEVWIRSLSEEHIVSHVHRLEGQESGDLLFLLAYQRIVPGPIRKKFRNCVVVHESDLPAGKGWSPLTWQVLEGESVIPIVLFDADDAVDAGAIYLRDEIHLEGHELVDELRDLQAQKTFELCRHFIDDYPAILSRGKEQSGPETFYRRRGPEDSQLDPDKTLREQFNLLRVVDNEKYPAFFDLNGRRYYISIRKAEQ